MKKNNGEITLKDVFSIFIPKLWLIAIAAIVCSLGLGLRTEFTTPDTYTASAVFHINKTGPMNQFNVVLAEEAIAVNSYTVKSTEFLTEVVSDVVYNPEFANTVTPSYVASAMSYKPIGNGLLRVSVTTTDPGITYAIATSLRVRIPLAFTNYEPEGTFAPIILQDIPSNADQIGVNPKSTVRDAVIGFVIGAAISAVGVFVYSLLDSKVRTKKKITDSFDLQVLAEIPRLKYNKDGEPDGYSNARCVEAYNSLCSSVFRLSTESKCKKIAITSAKYGEGKSELAINLAISVAENLRDKKVLFVDADMRYPDAAELLSEELSDVADKTGLAEYLAGDGEPNLIASTTPNLSILLAGEPELNPAALLCSARVGELLSLCEERFDYVIIHTPPVNFVSDAQLIFNRVDGYILSTKIKASTVATLDKALDTLSAIGANVYGTVLTDVK